MIWCVEDDHSIRDIEIYALKAAGFETKGFEDGNSFWHALQEEKKPDLIILDLMLPGLDGLELIQKMKSHPKLKEIPVIMATAKGSEFDRVSGLDLGADDYLVKPFSMMEMVSRVKAVLRRSKSNEETSTYIYQDLIIHWDQHTVMIKEERILLSYKEFELLRLLLKKPGVAYTRDQIFAEVWDSHYIGDSRTLDMHIRSLRQKLKEYGKTIETVRNVGYRWETKDGK